MPEEPNLLGEIDSLMSSLKNATGKEKAQLYEKMGDVYAKAEKITKAEILFKQALDAGGEGLPLMRKYMEMLVKTGQMSKSIQFLEGALKGVTDMTQRSLLIVRKAHLKWHMGEFEEGRKSAELALEILEKERLKDTSLMEPYADANNILGLCLWELARYDNALEKFDISSKTYESLKDFNGVAKVKNNTGLVLWQSGHFDEALKAYAEAITADEKNGGWSMFGHAQNNIAIILMERGDLDGAEGCIQISNKTFASQGFQRGIHMVELNFMDLNLERGDFVKATFWAERGLKGFMNMKDESRIAYAKYGMARIFCAKGDIKTAERYAMEAVKGAGRAKARETEGLALRALSEVEVKKGDMPYAETLMRRSLDIFRSVSFVFEIGRGLKELALLLHQKGQKEEAEKAAAEARTILSKIGAKLELERLELGLAPKA